MNSCRGLEDLGADHKKVTGMWFTDWAACCFKFALFAACLAWLAKETDCVCDCDPAVPQHAQRLKLNVACEEFQTNEALQLHISMPAFLPPPINASPLCSLTCKL